MEIIFEVLLGLLLEILGQGFFELLAEFGIRSLGHSIGLKKPVNPIMATVGYLILASVCGGLSLLIFPKHLIANTNLQLLNLLVTPIILGWIMSKRRNILVLKGKTPIRLDSFAYGFTFALAFGLIRFIYAK
jgi:hypothetical protein